MLIKKIRNFKIVCIASTFAFVNLMFYYQDKMSSEMSARNVDQLKELKAGVGNHPILLKKMTNEDRAYFLKLK